MRIAQGQKARSRRAAELVEKRAKRNLLGVGGGLVGLLFFVVLPVSSQSLGEVARQTRASRSSAAECAPRVLTNEDLSRTEILTPEERLRCTEARVKPGTPGAVPAAPEVAVTIPTAPTTVPQLLTLTPPPPGAPLGDVARYYRALKEVGAREPEAVAVPEPPEIAVEYRPGEPVVMTLNAAPPAPPADAPLGDVARYYRAVREARERQRELVERQNELEAVATQAVERQKSGAPPTRVESAPVVAEQEDAGRTIVVQRGDSLWKLAETHLGSGLRWRELAALNPEIADPNLIQVGQVLRLERSEAMTAKQRRVAPGDTLWAMAEAEYGNGLAWQCIAAANPQLQDANRIFPNQVLALPASCGSLL